MDNLHPSILPAILLAFGLFGRCVIAKGLNEIDFVRSFLGLPVDVTLLSTSFYIALHILNPQAHPYSLALSLVTLLFVCAFIYFQRLCESWYESEEKTSIKTLGVFIVSIFISGLFIFDSTDKLASYTTTETSAHSSKVQGTE